MRATVRGTAERPRLSVFRSNRFMLAQLINDVTGKTIASATSKGMKTKGTKTAGAEFVGKAIAETAKKAGITSVVFDRGSYRYHGRVAALVEAARKEGLKV